MPTEVTDVGPCKRRISVSIPPAEIKQAFSNAWSHARKHVQIKGFRPGKVPRTILEKRYGPQIEAEVKENLINSAFREAITSHSLKPLTMPQLDADKLELTTDKPFEFDLEVEIRPEFDLPSYKGIAVGAPPLQFKEEDVDRELERLRGRFAKLDKLEEGAATKGDYLLVDIAYKVDGATVQQAEGKVVDTNADVVDGIAMEGGTASFVGQEVGAVVNVPCKLPAEFEPSTFANAEAMLDCTIKAIHRVQLPELNDELAAQMGAENVEKLRSHVTDQYKQHLENQRNQYVEDRILDELIKATTFDLPQDILEKATHQAVHNLEHEMMQSGMEEAEAKGNAASHTDRVRQDQARGLRVSFLVDKIAEAEKVNVSDEELERAIYAMASVHQRDVQQVYDELVNAGRLHSLRTQILDSKIRKLLRESADIAEVSPESSDDE